MAHAKFTPLPLVTRPCRLRSSGHHQLISTPLFFLLRESRQYFFGGLAGPIACVPEQPGGTTACRLDTPLRAVRAPAEPVGSKHQANLCHCSKLRCHSETPVRSGSSYGHPCRSGDGSISLLLVVLVLVATCVAGPAVAADASLPATLSLQAAGEQLKALVAQYSDSPLGLVIFAAAYALLAVFLVPASFLTLAAGYIYGNLKGTVLVSVSATLGASLSFVFSRYLARPFVAERLASSRRFKAIDAGVAKSGARIVLLLRLSPLVPYGLCNYMLGLTGIDFTRFVLLSWVGMLPGTFAYVSLGGAGKASFEASTGGSLDAVRLGFYGLGAAASVLAVYFIGRIANDALQVPEDQA